MCKRSDNDPLVRVLADRYKLNILRLPRRGVGVGELLIREGKDLRCAGSIRRLFDPELEIPLAEPVPLPDVDGVTSARRSASVAGAPLTGLLTALGATGVSSIGAALRAAREISVAYSLTGTRYLCTDLVSLGDELSSRVLRQDNALYRTGRQFFVAHAAAEATGIKAVFSAATDRASNFTLELAAIIKAEASADVTSDQSGRLVISSVEPVTFGLAVVQLKMGGSSLRFEPAARPRPVRSETAEPRTLDDLPSVFFGGPADDVLVEVG